MDEAVVAGEHVDLVQFAISLGQVAAALLHQPLTVVVLLLSQHHSDVGVGDEREFVAVRHFPLGQEEDIVLPCLKFIGKVDRL